MPVKVVRRKLDKKKPGNNGWWSEKQRMDAVCRFMTIGNLNTVSKEMNIPYDTLRKWKGSDWWKEIEEQVRHQANTELSGKIGKLVHKAIDAAEERIDNGDWYFNKTTGKLTRVPVKARDSNQIAKDMLDRKVLLDKIATRGTVNEVTIEQRLQNLQEALQNFTKGHTIVREVIDVEVERNAPESQAQAPEPTGATE